MSTYIQILALLSMIFVDRGVIFHALAHFPGHLKELSYAAPGPNLRNQEPRDPKCFLPTANFQVQWSIACNILQ